MVTWCSNGYGTNVGKQKIKPVLDIYDIPKKKHVEAVQPKNTTRKALPQIYPVRKLGRCQQDLFTTAVFQRPYLDFTEVIFSESMVRFFFPEKQAAKSEQKLRLLHDAQALEAGADGGQAILKNQSSTETRDLPRGFVVQ